MINLKVPVPLSVHKAASAFGQDDDEVDKDRKGVLYSNHLPCDARFTDIFEGDELDNTMTIDIHKVQLFWFSVIAIGGYGVLMLNMFLTTPPSGMTAFPVMSDGFLALLTVSTGTYLAGKGITQTPQKE